MALTFSIITPSFNQGHLIEETIQSVLSQEVALEYWVIDGGSTDNTLSILKKYKKNHANFHYVSEKDEGQSDAINKGIAKATGDIIAYLNSDDVYYPKALQVVEEYFTAHPEAAWVYGRSQIVDLEGRPIQSFFSKVKNFLGKTYSYSKLLSFNIISQPAVFLRKEVFENCGLFHPEHHLIMDYDYWVRIGRKYPGHPILSHLAQYRFYPTSKSGSVFVKQYFAELKAAYAHSRLPWEFPYLFIHSIHFILVIVWLKWVNRNFQ